MSKKQSEYILKKPTLTLFAFSIRNELAQNKQSGKDSNLIWEWVEKTSKDLNIRELKGFQNQLKKYRDEVGLPPTQDYPDSDYLELLEERLINFFVPNNEPKITGAVYPLQINETYALDFILSYPFDTVKLSDLSGLSLNDILLPHNLKDFLGQNFLGQTLLFFVQPISVIKDYQVLAKKCLKYLFPQIKVKKDLTSGHLFGSPIFEYDNGQEQPGKNLHILIWFNSVFVTEYLVKEGSFYQPLISLLKCRSRILYAYSESRKSYESAKKLYQKLKNSIDRLHYINKSSTNADKKLKYLKQMLTNLSRQAFDYNRHLRDLEIQYFTIKVNIKNYSIYLQELQKASIQNRDNLQFLQSFISHATNKLAGQIQLYISYLDTGRELYGELIDSIRGIAEIEQAEIDRSLERSVQVFGVALAGGAIVSGVVAQHVEKPIKLPNSKYPLHPITTSLIWSFIATIVFGTAAWLWWRLLVPLLRNSLNSGKKAEKNSEEVKDTEIHK